MNHSPLILSPGKTTLAEWHAIYRGAEVTLDQGAYPTIAAGAAAVAEILGRGAPVYGINTGFGKLASVRIAAGDLAALQRNIVLSHAAGVGEPVPIPIARLMVALKLAGLAQGASGVRPEVVTFLERMLARDLIPVVPAQGSVGASGDLAPLAHLAAVMIGSGEIFARDTRLPAAEALAMAGLEPLCLGPKEGLALLNGTQFSTAHALAGLFEADRLFRAALVTGALATDAARGSDAPFDPRIHALRRHRGQAEVAAALAALMEGSAIRASHRFNDERVQDPYCVRCQPQVMGAALDVLRQAASTLGIEANGVTDNPLIFTDPAEALSGGNFHAEPVGFAADMIAMAVCEIGSIAERRLAMLVDPALSGLPAFLAPIPGLHSGFMIPQVTAAALVSENKGRAFPAVVDSIPTSANQEDHVSMAAHGARRLIAMTDNLRGIIAIEWLAAVQGCDFHPMLSSPALEQARAVLRARVPHLDEDRYFATDIEAAIALLADDALGFANLPTVLWNHFHLIRGDAPLILSIPHAGLVIPDDRARGLISLARARHDADWWLPELYGFAADLGATILINELSRTVIDVNRDPTGASLYPGRVTTALCPLETFDGVALYEAGKAPGADEIEARRRLFLDPYHKAIEDEVARLRARHDRVVLYDCHSIRSEIPRLFRGVLPHFNIGTNDGAAATASLSDKIATICAAAPRFSHVVNGRFKGGYITRHHGKPAAGVDAIQMELAFRAYVGEPAACDFTNWPGPYDPAYAAPARAVLARILESLLA